MKKSLLALAVLGAFAGAASAQSSVTLFGVVDLNLSYLDNAAGSQFTMGQDGIASSRLGFRGVEDLGGGLTASFWLEGAINPDTGTAGGQTWQRRSTVSLASGWGEVRLGRDYTATFWNSTIFDPFGTNGIGSAGNLAFVTPAAPTGGAYNTLVRANNMVGYFLPSGIAGGLYGQVQVAAGEAAPGNKYFGGRLGYASGPFNVAGAYGRTQVTIVPDQNGTNWNLGASWNFGFMSLSGYYGKLEVGTADQKNWFIGAQAPMGVWTFKGSYGSVSRDDSNALSGLDGQNADQFALGFTYDLSKRTALYGTYSHISNDDNARFVVGALQNVAAGGSGPNENSQGFQFGVKHSF
ncbi:MAG: porin [Ideonella sp.]|nr:porin [Ideonella sp.]